MKQLGFVIILLTLLIGKSGGQDQKSQTAYVSDESAPSIDNNAGIVRVIDIRAIAYEQVDQGDVTKPLVAEASQGVDIQLISFGIGCLTSLIGTIIMMTWITGSPKSGSAHNQRANLSKSQTAIDAVLAQAKLVLKEKATALHPPLAYGNGLIDWNEPPVDRAHKRSPGELLFSGTAETRQRGYRDQSMKGVASRPQSGKAVVSHSGIEVEEGNYIRAHSRRQSQLESGL